MSPSKPTVKEQFIYFLNKEVTQDYLCRFGCWVVAIAQNIMLMGARPFNPTGSPIFLLLVSELIFILAMARIRKIPLIRDLLDLSFYNILYFISIQITEQFFDVAYYFWLTENLGNFILTVTILYLSRVFFRNFILFSKNDNGFFPLGPFGFSHAKWNLGFFKREPVRATAFYLSVGGIFAACVMTLKVIPFEHKADAELVFYGLATIGLFVKFFIPFIQEAGAVADEAVNLKIKLVQLLHEKESITQELNRLGEFSEKYDPETHEIYEMLLVADPEVRAALFSVIRKQHQQDTLEREQAAARKAFKLRLVHPDDGKQ
jgi:hypothetical protein